MVMNMNPVGRELVKYSVIGVGGVPGIARLRTQICEDGYVGRWNG
jgi:hypothetical protein